ncbi:uncharacterized protein BXIN_1801 [Babesia sp. Xinjiang]|uniref:uncharacterized protein n=1 Tax=Babesia sp. Xinjiang TaxID=462227 RepID=UPI000A25BD07|nr:uncharacterized protein BXIN_1618 [Babesia sp. Xinjiang]XP_028871399.1 uncharacterized protein BXIN_1801 [Babesia sp. Xinjiang]ORM40936.1 hypothetical protein BXIN_1618 [Babesia sp. Xinjiang]ORM40943.1 hypothetical protein BXIN_1801 [Babesia sp. Xinjiang]
MTNDIKIDLAIIHRYNSMLESWERIQSKVDTNLRAMVIILDKFLLFTGADQGSCESDETTVDRILNSHAKGFTAQKFQDVSYDEAIGLLAGAKRAHNIDVNSVSPLTANLEVNLPGAISLFLQRQSDKLYQMISEVRSECESFRDGTLPRMESICDVAVAHINRNSVSIEEKCDNTPIFCSICDTFQSITSEIDALLGLMASVNPYPEGQENIHAHIEQISSFKLCRLKEFNNVLSDST